MDKNKILVEDKNNKQTIESKNIVLSTGSEAASLPGLSFDEEKILSSTGALNMSKVPRKMFIIGGGYIGLEMGSVWSRLGSEVHVIETLDHITPGLDKEISSEFLKILKKQGLKFHLSTKVEKVYKTEKGINIEVIDVNQKNIRH